MEIQAWRKVKDFLQLCFVYHIVIDAFIEGPLENHLVEGQPSLKELNMKKYEIYNIRELNVKMKYEYETLKAGGGCDLGLRGNLGLQ